MFMMIQNTVSHIPTVNVMSTLGASTARGNDNKIGQFGSGFKYSLAVLARHGLLDSLKICLGKDVYTFFTRGEDGRDSAGRDVYIEKIYMKTQGGSTYDLNISVNFGAMDWTSVDMALREFVSNAIDGQIEHTGRASDVKIEPVEKNRAKDGFIRIYVEMTRAVERYFDTIKDKFICLRHSYNPRETVLEKENQGPARIYRKGVLVGEFGDMSLFDYNIPNIELKESRIVDSYEAERSAAAALVLDTTGKLAKYFEAMGREDVWELDISPYYFNLANYKHVSAYPEMIKNYASAFLKANNGAVACRTKAEASAMEAKGYDAIVIPKGEIFEGLIESGADTSEKLMSKDEREGRVIVDTLPSHTKALDYIWGAIVRSGLHANKDKPSLKSFRRVELHDKRDAHALYDCTTETVLMNAECEDGTRLYKSLIHELAHHITGANDGSLPMQEFGFALSAFLLS